jgi:hypothetical protein
MAVINNKFSFTLTDDAASDPIIDEVVNFTDNSGDTYFTKVKKLVPGDSTTAPTWDLDTETTLLDLSSEGALIKAKYLVIQVDHPVYMWFGVAPTRDVDGKVDITVSPEFRVDRLMVVSGPAGSGSVQKIYAINPDRDNSTTNFTVTVKLTVVYV